LHSPRRARGGWLVVGGKKSSLYFVEGIPDAVVKKNKTKMQMTNDRMMICSQIPRIKMHLRGAAHVLV
jgi:hypothetical protein